MPSDEEAIRKWSRATLHRFMIRLWFTSAVRKSHYANSRLKPENIALRDNYLEWVQKYTDDD